MTTNGDVDDVGTGTPPDKPGDEAPAAIKYDDEAPPSAIKDYEKTQALSTTSQGIGEATVTLHSKDPVAIKAREELEKKFRTEISESPPGDLWQKFDIAMDWFKNIAHRILGHRPNDDYPLLADWIKTQLDARDLYGGTVYSLLFGREQVRTRLAKRWGDREGTLINAAATTDLWELWFKQWSDPVATIDARIGTSEADLEQINTALESRRNINLALYQLFFEVAPRLLAVAPEHIPHDVKEAIVLVRGKLSRFDDRVKALTPASERKTDEFGGVWMSKEKVQEMRIKVLSNWNKSAEAEADAQAESKLRRDDAQTLKSRLDTLKQIESQLAKDLLSDTPSP